MSSVNTYKLPLIGGMYEIASQTFESEYYGYINGDILLSPNVFEILERCKLNAEAGLINRRVSHYSYSYLYSYSHILLYIL